VHKVSEKIGISSRNSNLFRQILRNLH